MHLSGKKVNIYMAKGCFNPVYELSYFHIQAPAVNHIIDLVECDIRNTVRTNKSVEPQTAVIQFYQPLEV